MAIFPILKSEDKAQVEDLIRLSAIGSLVSGEADVEITKIEIQPEASAPFANIPISDPTMWYLDWMYSTAGEKDVTVRITVTGDVTATRTKKITVLTAADDYLFSTDNDIKTMEPDILKWIPEGYSSWNHVHRAAQESILDWLDEIRLVRDDGTRFEAKDVVDRQQVRRLSKLMALKMIYFGLANQDADVFLTKFEEYKKLEGNARNRNYLKLDFEGNGEASATPATQSQDLRTMRMVKR